jgi:hypothetical protein
MILLGIVLALFLGTWYYEFRVIKTWVDKDLIPAYIKAERWKTKETKVV